jgi:hypothetical protein
MDEASVSSPKPVAAVRSTRRITKTLLYVVVVILVSGLAAAGIYYWQHRSVNNLNKRLASDNHKVSFLQTQQSGLSKQIASLNAQNYRLSSELSSSAAASAAAADSSTAQSQPSQPPLDITVLGGQRYSYTPSSGSTSQNDIVVDVTIKSASTTTINLPISDLELKDENDDTGADFGDFAGNAMSNGDVVLDDQSLAPGQSVTGALVFVVLDANYDNYTLVYGSQSYPVSIT